MESSWSPPASSTNRTSRPGVKARARGRVRCWRSRNSVVTACRGTLGRDMSKWLTPPSPPPKAEGRSTGGGGGPKAEGRRSVGWAGGPDSSRPPVEEEALRARSERALGVREACQGRARPRLAHVGLGSDEDPGADRRAPQCDGEVGVDEGPDPDVHHGRDPARQVGGRDRLDQRRVLLALDEWPGQREPSRGGARLEEVALDDARVDAGEERAPR